ncbi:MAG: site-specific integrase [Candidatus Methanoperedens sp.]|nr:site-specific integrase [Candidatus Methanoperedens sp.]
MILMISKFLQEEEVNYIKPNTIQTHRSILNRAEKYKSLSEWDKNIFNQYIIDLQKRSKRGTVEITKSILRKYFVWLGKSEMVAHIRVKMPKSNLKRDDILSVEDVNKLIETIDSPMYKALISFLFESGGRINEVLAVKVEDIEETDRGMIISVPSTKTGEDHRRSLYTFSASYIRNHLTYAVLKKEDRLFPVKRAAVAEMLHAIEGSAKTGKHVNPHAFRHARATDLVLRGCQESIIRKHLGWVGDSKMIATYQHIVDEDVINAMEAMDAVNPGETPVIIRKPVGKIKKAEPISVADAALQLGKIAEDNRNIMEALKENEDFSHQVSEQNDELRKEIVWLKQRVGELLEELHS